MQSFLRSSDVLASLASGPGERVSVEDILLALRTRAFALLVVVLGLPNCLPMPPPIPLICGLLLIFVSLQMVFGLHAPWLPRRIARQSVLRADIARAVERSLPIVQRLERHSRARFAYFDGALGSRLVGVLLLLLSVGLLLAAPFVGQIPMGISVCLVGLGLVERDGLIVLGGFLIGLAGIAINIGFVLTIVHWVLGFF